MTKPWGPGRGMSGDVIVGPFEGVDESERGFNSMLFEVVFDCLFDVVNSQGPRDDWLFRHAPGFFRT